MGRIVKQISENTTKYYWYPGDKQDWIRAAIAVGAGVAMFVITRALTDGPLWGAVLGASTTLAVAGFNFGRRDARALATFPDIAAARRAAMVDTGRAAWRALVEGFGAAAAAVLIVNIPRTGFAYNWILPVVPAVIGALGHQAGMLYERMQQTAAAAAAATKEASPVPAPPAEAEAGAAPEPAAAAAGS
ncbi:hypothetical protein [Longispora albida]|uniref:hypothetical protein n=1 Tax=Longispora albida TaxID=203523 RepID=UPI0006854603|nr:hypothetical protein [Longispora albida]